MRHNVAHKKFNRTTNQRKALLIGLCNQIIQKGRIITTLPKAKAVRPMVERLVTYGRNEVSLHRFRVLMATLRSKSSCEKIVSQWGPKYKERPGGYLRIIKAGFRKGDSAPMALIEFVEA
ncbi:50S ribosomal protein L17 [Holospora elegans E1]|uniref:50S ribosomal protein L17 n=1 Tax=Holospora elegans E1 TaxID=1427503 RepID=A0A023DZ15_9PROT|nr:50S ribosomal protein L17 [Holospora elegans]GAJ46771.1 50S ribosomal protein L17 [Holospora elegans E1]